MSPSVRPCPSLVWARECLPLVIFLDHSDFLDLIRAPLLTSFNCLVEVLILRIPDPTIWHKPSHSVTRPHPRLFLRFFNSLMYMSLTIFCSRPLPKSTTCKPPMLRDFAAKVVTYERHQLDDDARTVPAGSLPRGKWQIPQGKVCKY